MVIVVGPANTSKCWGFVWDMYQYVGTVQQIISSSTHRNGQPYYTIPNCDWIWVEDWFAPTEPNKIYLNDIIGE